MEAPPAPHREGVWVGQGRVRPLGASKVAFPYSLSELEVA